MAITRQNAAYLLVLVFGHLLGIGLNGSDAAGGGQRLDADLFALAFAVYCLFNRHQKPIHQ